MWNWFTPSNLTSKEQIDQRRSRVRVWVTYSAAVFVFVGSPVLMGFLIYKDKYDEALGLFNTILPVATGVISFWFAARSVTQQSQPTEQGQGKNDGKTDGNNKITHEQLPPLQDT